MAPLRGLKERIKALFGSRGMDAEMDEELRFHLERETEKNIHAGMDPRDARRKAMVDFGGVERFREKSREERGVMPLDPIAVGGGTLVLVLASMLAGVVPARRLLGAQPMQILREE